MKFWMNQSPDFIKNKLAPTFIEHPAFFLFDSEKKKLIVEERNSRLTDADFFTLVSFTLLIKIQFKTNLYIPFLRLFLSSTFPFLSKELKKGIVEEKKSRCKEESKNKMLIVKKFADADFFTPVIVHFKRNKRTRFSIKHGQLFVNLILNFSFV
ncbi:hypothetical protein BpHYR1_041788 [Brachionus plicatilis]|uniref:Uncharacterized protein n=1 Tax=Brachionus plicatilis TaxID=10195 RepID=A0A3M7QGZ6_BRAPC|nr:hypothetical protein BpHYR1_041788 [Brachionus plicatilis]